MGGFDTRCVFAVRMQNPGADRSQMDVKTRAVAIDNMLGNERRLPATLLARSGRLLAVYRPAQTVQIDADWYGSASWPVWAWVTSYWLLVPLAVAGGVVLRRSRRFQWPLVAPAVLVLLLTAATFGDPRYHIMADLGVLVLVAVAACALVRRRPRPADPGDQTATPATAGNGSSP